MKELKLYVDTPCFFEASHWTERREVSLTGRWKVEKHIWGTDLLLEVYDKKRFFLRRKYFCEAEYITEVESTIYPVQECSSGKK